MNQEQSKEGKWGFQQSKGVGLGQDHGIDGLTHE